MESVRTWTYLVLMWGALFAFPCLASGASDPTNPGILEIPDPGKYERVIAISDAHARYGSAEKLLRAYDLIDDHGRWAGGKTLFIVVGDSINKGRKSLKLLDLWIRLQREAERAGGKLVHTLGNHEAGLLARSESFFQSHPELMDDLEKNDLTIDQFLHRGSKRGRFLHAMPAGVRVGNVLFVHSGMLPAGMTWDEFVAKAKVEIRQGKYDSSFLMGRDSILNSEHWGEDAGKIKALSDRMRAMGLSTIVFGHDVRAFGEDGLGRVDGRQLVSEGERSQLLVKIDSGMGKGKEVSRGRLLFFGKPEQMAGQAPPRTVQFSSRKMRKMKSLGPCEKLYLSLE